MQRHGDDREGVPREKERGGGQLSMTDPQMLRAASYLGSVKQLKRLLYSHSTGNGKATQEGIVKPLKRVLSSHSRWYCTATQKGIVEPLKRLQWHD